VAELNEDYIAKMENVLETYEQTYDPKQPVVCLDEKPEGATRCDRSQISPPISTP
jgi:hypothetical protein